MCWMSKLLEWLIFPITSHLRYIHCPWRRNMYNLSVECRDHINKLTSQWYEECSTEQATTAGLQRKPHTIADVVGDHVIEEGAKCNEKVTNSIGLSSWMMDGPVEIVD